MPRYYLVDDGIHMPRWCQLAAGPDGSFWIDFKARRIPYDDGQPLAHVEGEDMMTTVDGVPDEIAELERSYAFERLLDPWSDQGWIAPDGKFWGCSFYVHDDIAYALLRKHPAALEHQGWVRVHADSFRTDETFRRITKRQEATLLALGFPDAVPGSGGVRRFAEPDRNAPPPRYAVRRPAGMNRIQAAPPAVARPNDALTRLAERLCECPELATLFGLPFEAIPEVGPGTWDWMLRWDEVDLGGEEPAAWLLEAEGLHLRATSFNTVEVAPWPEPGIHVEASTAALLPARAARRSA